MKGLVISLLAAATLLSCQSTAQTGSADDPPNVILIMTDDQGYGDFGFMGNTVIETPNLDKMQEGAAQMNRFYVSPVCAPTRACLMTGRYNYRTRAIDTYVGRAQMAPEEVTVAELLRGAGYSTGIFGKWHLGDNYPMRSIDQGFEESLVHKGGGLAQPSDPVENERRYTDPILFHNGSQVHASGYCTDIYFKAAQQFIRERAAANKPFFAYIATNAPHGPYHDVPAELRKKYEGKNLLDIAEQEVSDQLLYNMQSIAAMIENVDQNIGRLFESLDELNLTDNTLVLFMVDNGPNSRRFVGPLRGMKSEVYEGGIRSPLLAHWPNRLSAGNRSDRIAAHIDIMPTILAATGVPVPEDLDVDGRNILPLLEGEDVVWEDRYLFIQSHRGDVPKKDYHFAAIGQQYKYLRHTGFGLPKEDDDTPYELYDLIADPGEQNNLLDSLHEKAEEFQRIYDAWFEDVSSTRPDNYAKPRMILGTSRQTEMVFSKQDWERTAGNGWGQQGKWYVQVAESSRYQVEVILMDTVILESNESSRLFKIAAADQEWSIEIPEGQRRAVFESIEMPAGNIELTGTEMTAESRGPYQLIFRQI